MKQAQVRLLVFAAIVIAAAHASCWTAVVYHTAASALATGLGDTSSAAVCAYTIKGNNTNMDNECPPPCKALLVAAWGDCYCRDPHYRPLSMGADRLVYNLSVAQMFELVGTRRHVAAAYCRDYLQENTHIWNC